MNEFRQHYEITANSKSFESAVNSSIKVSAKFNQAVGNLSKQVRGFNEGLNRFVGPSGKMISNLSALNSVGAITSKQYKELIAIYDALEKKYKDDVVALAGITSARRSLNSSIGLETASRKRLNEERERQLSLEERLAAAGIKTTAAYQREIAALDQLQREIQGDDLATAQLIARKEELQNEITNLDQAIASQARSTKLSQFTLLNFGFAVQDASTFSQGFAFGLRSIANNLDGVLRSFGELRAQEGGFRGAFRRLAADLKSPGGLLVILNLVTTAAVVLFEVFNKRGKELDKIAERSKALTASLVAVKTGFEGFQFTTDLGGLEESVEATQRAIKTTREELDRLRKEQSLAQSAVFVTGGVVVDQRSRQEREEANAAIREQEDLLKRLEESEKNRREILEEQRAIAKEIEVLRASGLSDERDYLPALSEINQRLNEAVKMRRVLAGLGAANLATVSREADLLQRNNELIRAAADLNARQLSLGRELEQAARKGANEAQNAILDQRIKLQEEQAAILVRQNATISEQEKSLAKQAGTQGAISGLIDEQLDAIEGVANAQERAARSAERHVIVLLELKQAILEANQEAEDAQVRLRALQQATASGERDRLFDIESQNERLSEQLALQELLRRASRTVRNIDPVDTLDLDTSERLREEIENSDPISIAIELAGADAVTARMERLFNDLSATSQATALAIQNELSTVPRQLSEETIAAHDASLAATEDYKNEFLKIIKLMILGHNEEFAKATAKTREFFGELSGLAGAFTGIAQDNLREAEDNYRKAVDRQQEIAKTASVGFQQIAAESTRASKKQAQDALRAYKAQAISEAIINALLAGSQVWASKMPLAAKVIASAAVVANGFRIVNQIRRVNIDGGGGASGSSSPGLGGVFQKERPELFLGGLQPNGNSVLPAIPGAPGATGILPGVTPSSSTITLQQAPVNVTITPNRTTSGDILWSVEQGLETRAAIGLSRTIQVPR